MSTLSRPRLRHLAVVAALVTAAFLVLAVVPWPPLRHVDAAAPAAGHAWLVHATVARDVTLVVTDLGSPVAVDVVTAVAIVVLLVLRRWRAAVVVAVARLGELVTETLLKIAVHRARPDLLPHLVSAGGASFPSGHTAGSAAVYGTVVIVLGARLAAPVRRRLLVAAGVWVALVAASRVLLGVHFPTDVLGGVAVGVAWIAVALLAVPARSGRTRRQENDKRHPAG